MRPGTDAEPVAVTPVAQVVSTAFAGKGPVRDLVVPVTVLPQDPFGELVQARDTRVVGLGRCRAAPPALYRTPAGSRPVRHGRRLHRAQVEGVAERRTQARDLLRLQQARCTASDVERRDPRPPQAQALAPDLDVESFHIPRPKRAPRWSRREVTVRAPSSAERDVHIEA